MALTELSSDLASGWERLVRLGEGRVHRSVYTDPGIFELELENIFRQTWIYVAHESEIPNPGDFKATYVGREPVIVTRGRDGVLRVLMNRCLHRAALICRQPCGNANNFQCLYHGWTYSVEGKLIAVPHVDGFGESFDKDDYNLLEAGAVDSYRGFIFASLSGAVEPLRSFLGGAAEHLDRVCEQAPDGEIRLNRGVERYQIRANWKLQVDNVSDGYHPNFTHATAFEAVRKHHLKGVMQGGNVRGSLLESYHRGHCLIEYGREGHFSAQAKTEDEYRERLTARVGAEAARELADQNFQLMVYPNLFIQQDRQHIRVFRPVGVDQTDVEIYPYSLAGSPEERETVKLDTVAWWASAAGFGQPDDIEAMTNCQDGLAVTSAEWLLFNRGMDREETIDGGVRSTNLEEVGHRGFQREWLRLMNAGAR